MIQFRCECGKMLQARDEQAGLPAACPICARVAPVPLPPDAPRVFGLTPDPLPEPPPLPRRPRPPALRPEPTPLSAKRSPVRAVLAALFVLGLVGLGVYLGWRRNTDESFARRMLEAELPKQNNIRVKSIDLRPLPPEQGGGRGDFTGTVTDQDGKVWELARVRVRKPEVEWLVRQSDQQLREWAATNIEKLWSAKIKTFELGRTPDGRRTAKILTGEDLVIELEESPVETAAGGRLGVRDPQLRISRASLPRYWELSIRKEHPELTEVKLKEDGDDSWSGTARDHQGGRFTVSVKRAPPEKPGDEEAGYVWQLFPVQDE